MLSFAIALTLFTSTLLGQSAPSEPSAPGELPGAPLITGGQPGDKSLTTRLSFYANDDNGDGNPFLDETLTVIEPVILFDHTVSKRFGYAVQFHYDQVSSASIDRLSNFPDQSGASGDNYVGGNVAGRWNLEDGWHVGGNVGFSTEYDYNSVGVGGNVSRDLAGQDATVGLSLGAFFDDIQVIRFDGSEDGNDIRTSLNTSATWYQVISPTTHGTFGATVALQNGFLSTPYNAVVIEDPLLPPNPNLDNMARGIEITEELPEDRLRLALFGRVRHSLRPGRSIEMGGRIYSDDWGINSVAIEPRWYETLLPGKLDGMLRYRFYTQTESDHFSDHFFATEEFRTQDSDLGAFNSHTIGGRLIWHVGRRNSLSLGLDTVLRSDGLDQILTSIAWQHQF